MRDQIGHRHADAHDFGRQVIHFEEALVEEDEPLIGIDHAEAVRHTGERRFMQRKQVFEPIRLISLNRVRRVHAAVAFPPKTQRLRKRLKLRVNRLGLNCVTAQLFAQ